MADHIDDLISNVEKTGAVLGDKATRLSSIIEEVDFRLREMDGKTAVSVEEGFLYLTFAKLGGGWGLWLCDHLDDDQKVERLINVSISRKAKAFPLLLRLLVILGKEQNSQLQEVEAALDSLSAFKSPFLPSVKEGQ